MVWFTSLGPDSALPEWWCSLLVGVFNREFILVRLVLLAPNNILNVERRFSFVLHRHSTFSCFKRGRATPKSFYGFGAQDRLNQCNTTLSQKTGGKSGNDLWARVAVAHYRSYFFSFPCLPTLLSICPSSPFHLYNFFFSTPEH